MEKTNQPLYQQLMEDVRSQIENSLLLPGDKLPTEREFMQKYNVSRITVSKALNELKAEGLITRFPNKALCRQKCFSPCCCGSGPAGSSQCPDAGFCLRAASCCPGRQYL